MALHYDLTQVKHRLSLHPTQVDGESQRMNYMTERLIWATMSTGIGKISPSNAEEFYTRLAIWERYHNPRSMDGFNYTTATDVLDHIGLRTNVWPYLSRAEFLERMVWEAERGAASSFQLAMSEYPTALEFEAADLCECYREPDDLDDDDA